MVQARLYVAKTVFDSYTRQIMVLKASTSEITCILFEASRVRFSFVCITSRSLVMISLKIEVLIKCAINEAINFVSLREHPKIELQERDDVTRKAESR